MRRFSASLVGVCALALAACGGSSHPAPRPSASASVTPAHVAPSKAVRLIAHPATNRPVQTHDIIVPLQAACPPHNAQMGCSVQPTATVRPDTLSAGINGPLFPDVSDWQGHPNWDLAASHIYGAVAKLGEATSLDPDVAYNVAAFRRLHIRWSVYLFVRPIGCVAEGQAIVNLLAQIGGPSTTGPVAIADEEVPGLAGYAPCIDGVVYAHFHRHIAVYTSPGTWGGGSGGGLDGWLASYGPSSPPACPWGCRVAAWQFTDGQFGPVTPIPGIGSVDVSVSYSLFSTTPPKPRTVCWGKGSTPTSSACQKIEAQAKAYWVKYLPFARAIPVRTKQEDKIVGVIAALESKRGSVYQSYKGPGKAWIDQQLAAERKWSAHYKGLHDQLVGRYHA